MIDEMRIVQEAGGRWALVDRRTRQPMVVDGKLQSNLTLRRVARTEDRLIQQDRRRAAQSH